MQGRGDDLAARDGTNYFEKICLRGPAVERCRDRSWAFERLPAHKLEGFDDKIVEQVPNRRDCEELCLAEPTFPCLSAGAALCGVIHSTVMLSPDYNIVSLTCSLSRETRRSKPASLQPSRDTVRSYS